jgi:hypothetical protein
MVAATAAALLLVACASAPGPSLTSSALATNSTSAPATGPEWPPFEPRAVHEAVATTLGMGCTAEASHIRCALVRDSGAQFNSDGPDGTDPTDRHLTFTASGPRELEVEARRLFSTVADAVALSAELSAAWQDQIWHNFAEQLEGPAALPNGVIWTAHRETLGAELIWRLTLTW